MIEVLEAVREKLIYDILVILLCISCVSVVGLVADKITSTRVRGWALLWSPVLGTGIMVLLVIIPLYLDVAVYSELCPLLQISDFSCIPLLHPLLFVCTLVTVLSVWGCLYRCMMHASLVVDNEVDRERRLKKEVVNIIREMLDRKEAYAGKQLQEHLDRSRDDRNQDFEKHADEMRKMLTDAKYAVDRRVDRADDAINQRMDMVESIASIASENMDERQIRAESAIDKSCAKIDELGKDVQKLEDEIKGNTGKMRDMSSEISDMRKLERDNSVALAALIEMLSPGADTEDPESAPGDSPPSGVEEICREYGTYGFRAVPGENRSNPDILLYNRDNSLVAAVCVRHRTIRDDVRDRTKRIGRKMCAVELRYAADRGVKMVLLVVNAANGRRWTCVVPSEDLEGWSGATTPDILAKEDAMSGQSLERRYRDDVIGLGGVV